VSAQYRRAPAIPAYALKGVTVVRPGSLPAAGVTVVVRGPLIEAMGPGVDVPADARVLEGDSLWLYPGLVDAEGGLRPAFPDPESEEKVLSWAPTRRASGFMPHRMASHYLTASATDLKTLRRHGIVASGVHPDGGFAPGQSAAVIHRAHAARPWDLVASETVGLSMSFQGARGVYPATLFGVIAYIRQAFLDASRDGEVQASFAADPAGMTRPRFDPDDEALLAAANGGLPVFFRAGKREEIRRVLRLADEVGFRPVIVGGEEAGLLADTLAIRHVPVLLSVDFEEPDAWNPADTSGAPLKPAAVRERRRLETAYSAAAKLHEAGVVFALTTGGGEGDLLAGARKAVEYGLSEAAALAAMTTTPATLLGVSDVVRVAPGAAATFIITDGPLLEDDTKVVYTFVEGALEERAAEESGGGGEKPAADLTGQWEMKVTAQGTELTVTLHLVQDGGSLSGTMSSPEMGESKVSGGSISGTSVSLTVTSPDLPGPLTFTGTVMPDGTRMKGSASTPFGELTFTARKKPGPGSGEEAGGTTARDVPGAGAGVPARRTSGAALLASRSEGGVR